MDDVTLGELARRMESIHVDVKELRAAVVNHDDLAIATKGWDKALEAHEAFSAARAESMSSRISDLEAWQTWVVRIVIGIVMAAALGLVVNVASDTASKVNQQQEQTK